MTTRGHRTLLALALVLATTLAAATFAPSPVRAAGPPDGSASEDEGWGVIPLRRDGEAPRPAVLLDLEAGGTVEDVVLVVNDRDTPLQVELYAADAETLDDGSFTLESDRERRDAMGAWIELGVTEAVVEPGQALPVPFTVHVPDDAPSGDLSGGIVAIEAEASAVETDDQAVIGVKHGVGVRVHGRVSGPAAPDLEVVDVSIRSESTARHWFGLPAPVAVTYTVQNTGNLRLAPTIEVDVRGGGRSVRLPERELVDFLPGATATFTEEVPGIWPVGPVSAEITASALGQHDTARPRVLLLPWAALALLAVALVGAVWYLRRRRLRRRAA